MAGGAKTRGASSSSGRKPTASKKGLQQRFEINARVLFLSASGQFFREKLMALGLDKRWGSLDWWLNEGYVTQFFSHLKVEDGVLILKDGRIQKKIDREFISVFTGIPLNPDYDPLTQVAFEKARLVTGPSPEDMQLFTNIAPYASSTKHLVRKQGNWARTKGLQENQVLVAKWFKANFVGTGLRHLVDGKVGWFLHRLNTDSLGGWDACETIVMTFKNCTRKGAIPLPFLASMIWAHLKGLKRGPNDIGCNPCNAFSLLKCDIPGFWNGYRVEDPALRPYICDTIEQWMKWKEDHGVEALGGGWMYDWKDTMNVGARGIPPQEEGHDEEEMTQEDPQPEEEHHDMDVEQPFSQIRDPADAFRFTHGYSGYHETGVPAYHSNQFIPYEAFQTVGYFRQIPTVEAKLDALGDALAIQLSLLDQQRIARGDPRPQIKGANWDARDEYYRQWFCRGQGEVPDAGDGAGAGDGTGASDGADVAGPSY